MNFKEWLKASGVKVSYEHFEETYENLDNIIGKQVWICDYRLNDNKDAKPIRNVTPKSVEVVDNKDNLPKYKNVYYSPIHFREIKSNGKTSSIIIAPFDNTGYRGYTGVSVNIFNTKEQCVKHFKKQCDEAIKSYQDELDRRTTEIHNRIDEIESLKNKYDKT